MLARLRRSSLLSSIGYLLSGTLVARLFSALTLILIARQLGPAQFGQYTACFTLAWLSSPLFSLGLDNWLLGHGRRSGRDGELTLHASTVLGLKAGLGLLWLGGIGLLAQLLNPQTFPPLLLILAGLTVWWDELGRVVWAAFQTAQRNRSTLLLMVLMQGLIFASVGALYWTGETDGVRFALFQAGATGAGCVLGILWQVRRIGFGLEWQRLWPTARAALPFGLSVALAIVYGRVDIVLVAQMLDTGQAGLYAPAVSLITALGLVPLVLYNVYLPVLGIAHERDRSEMHRRLGQALLLGLLGGLLLGAGVAALSAPVVHLLYGPAFAPTARVLTILSGVLLARSVSLSAAAGLIAINRQGKRVRLQFVAALFNIVANLAVIPLWGITGAAIVFVLTEGGLAVAYLITLWSWFRKDRPMGETEL